ncbi:hypothetical protein CRUP_004464 [Coryphaenoides rupestris]|nr:hypothetical protein CRUP_004464 [Coryphaenoides rupestris]
MTNLRVFMSERLSSAAVDIFGEVEKVVTLYRAEFCEWRPRAAGCGVQVYDETPSGFLPMCPSAVSSDLLEEWSKQTLKAKASAVSAAHRESNGVNLNQGSTPQLPHESPPAKTQNSDHSFCHLCGKPFRYIGSLMKHIKMHDDHTVNCGICNRPCQNINDLLSHLRCAHRGSYFCHICGKVFSKQCFLIIHSKQHKGSKPFACEDWQQSSRKGAS